MKIKRIQIIITTFALCILTQTTYAQKIQTMLQKENLKGKVKSIYLTNEDSLYIKIWFDKTGKITKKEEKRENTIIWDNYDDYYEIYETYLDGLHNTRIIKYYE